MLSALNGVLWGPNQPPVPPQPTPPQPGLCVKCGFQPQARDPTTGNYFVYCSNACAAPLTLPGLPAGPRTGGGPNTNPNTSTSANAGTSTGPTPILNMCINCKKRPRYTDGAVEHPYCGRTCANLAKAQRLANTNTSVPTSPVNTTNPSVITNPFQATTPGIIGTPLNTTTFPNTRNGFVFANPRHSTMPTHPANVQNNRSSVYWAASSNPNGLPGKSHADAHKKLRESGCISCRKAPTNGSTVFCQACYSKLLSTAPAVVQVPKDHEKYKSVESQFQQKWLHNGRCPKVRAIYKIVNTTANVANYKQYLDQVEAKGNFASRNKPRGNERRRWHGTTRMCSIGDGGVTKFCSSSSCSLCCIMKTSFNLSSANGFGMFGAGIYTSSTSSKSDCYSRNGFVSDSKAMLLNKVVVGKGYKLTAANTSLTSPPAGHDSVLAETGAGLNYDELIVYNNDAIRPSYLLIYDTPK